MKKIALLITTIVILTGCATIPPQSIELNKAVSSGVVALKDNAIDMVNAWEKSAHLILDESWEKVYDKAESDYRSSKGLAAGATLSSDQLKDVAGLSAIYRDETRKIISDEAEAYRVIIRKNASETAAANDSITELLHEANRAIGKRQVVMDQVQGIMPIPSSITSFINTTIDNL